MTKVVRMCEKISKREEMRRAIRFYEKRKESLNSVIDWLRENNDRKPRKKL